MKIWKNSKPNIKNFVNNQNFQAETYLNAALMSASRSFPITFVKWASLKDNAIFICNR